MKKLIFILLILVACKKDSDTQSADSWLGTYSIQSQSCNIPSYSGTASSTITIDNNSAFTIPSGGLNTYLNTPIRVTINGDAANIPFDEMTYSDNMTPGQDHWDFGGGNITKSGNTLTVHYSFTLRFDNGSTQQPTYDVTYSK